MFREYLRVRGKVRDPHHVTCFGGRRYFECKITPTIETPFSDMVRVRTLSLPRIFIDTLLTDLRVLLSLHCDVYKSTTHFFLLNELGKGRYEVG